MLTSSPAVLHTSLKCIIIYIGTYCIRCWDLGGYFISHRVKYASYFDTGIINRVVFYFETRKSRSIEFFFFVHVSSERKTDGQFNSRKSAAPQRIFTTKPTYKSFKYFISAYILYTMYILLCMRVARERENVDDYVLKSSNVNLRISPIRLSMLIFWWNLSSFFDFARVIRYVYFVRVQEMCYDARLIDKFMRFFFIYFYSSLYIIYKTYS